MVRQMDVLAAVDAQTRARGYPPSMVELGCLLGIGDGAILLHYQNLRGKGMVQWEVGKKRTVRLTALGHEALARRRFIFMPVVGGRVRARHGKNLDSCRS